MVITVPTWVLYVLVFVVGFVAGLVADSINRNIFG